MPQTALANLGLNAFYDAGDDGWKNGVDNNWATLDALLQGGITVDPKSVTAQPGSPTDGAVYILNASASGAQWGAGSEGDVAIFNTNNPNNSGWTILTPREGWILYDRVNDRWVQFDGTAHWYPLSIATSKIVNITSTATLTIRENEINTQLDLNPSAAKVIDFPQDSTEPFPIGARILIRNLSANIVTFTDNPNVTWEGEDPTSAGTSMELKQDNWILFQKVATNEWRIEDVFLTGAHNTDINGFTTTVNVDIDYTRRGEQIELDGDIITGTSNSTAKTAATDLPAYLRPASGKRIFIRTKDNGAANFSMGNVNIAATGVITFYVDLDSGSNWTNSGVATIAGYVGNYARNL